MSKDYNLQEIPLLKKITKIETVNDLARLADFVYTTIPHALDNGIDLNYDIVEMYHQFMNKEKWGWCYMHAIYMHLLLQEYNRDSYVYDYGLPEEQLTHSVVIVTLRDNRYLIDPYFNRFYVNDKNEPLTFHDLLVEAARASTKLISVYGPGLKEVKQGEGYVKMSGTEFYHSVMNSWKVNQDYDKVMQEKLGGLNPFLLMPRKIQKVVVLKKLDGSKYYEFF